MRRVNYVRGHPDEILRCQQMDMGYAFGCAARDSIQFHEVWYRITKTGDVVNLFTTKQNKNLGRLWASIEDYAKILL
jgi:hypothetical protein